MAMIGHLRVRLVVLVGEVVDRLGLVRGQRTVALHHGHSGTSRALVLGVDGGDGVAVGRVARGVSAAEAREVGEWWEVLCVRVQLCWWR